MRFSTKVTLAVVLGASLALHAVGPSEALAATCGVRTAEVREPTAADALAVLASAVGRRGVCGPCVCDVDNDGSIDTADALRVLRRAVGLPVTLTCPDCSCPTAIALDTDASPRSIATADLDGDGIIEIVTANTDADSVTVHFAGGSGTVASLAVSRLPQSAELADLDGDDAPDLIVSHAVPGVVSILAGNGDGTFAEPRVLEAGQGPINTAVGDLDRDGAPDLVTANSTGDDLSIRLGNGDGTFSAETRHAVGRGPRWVTLAHIDRDGRLDAVTANRDGNDLTIAFGNGDGTFTNGAPVAVAAGPYQVRAAHLDADASTDLLVASYADRVVSVLHGAGNGTFRRVDTFATGGGAIGLALGDVDGDGDHDVAVANYRVLGEDLGGAVVLRAENEGVFGPPLELRLLDELPGRVPTRAVAIVDATGDGNPDIVAAQVKARRIAVFPGRGDGTFEAAPGLYSTATINTVDAAVADLDRDGNDDIAMANHRNAATVVLGEGNGRFGPRNILRLARSAQSIDIADINHDGVLDLVLGTGDRFIDRRSSARGILEDPKVSVMLGIGDGSFADELRVSDAPFFSDLAVGEVTGDTFPDLVGREFRTGALLVRAGNGDGSFAAGAEVEPGITVTAAELLDVDADGRVDLVTLDTGEAGPQVRYGDAAGGFGAALALPTDRALSDGMLGDVNADGRPDIIYVDGVAKEILTFVATAARTYAPPSTSPLPIGAWRGSLGDLDEDGFEDVALPSNHGLLLLRGDGAGGFTDATLRATPTLKSRYSVTAKLPFIADWDDDGRLDVAAILNHDFFDNYVFVLPQAGNCLAPAGS